MGRRLFGVRLPNSGPFAARGPLLEVARQADALGFDSVWVHDHIPWSREKRTHFAAGSIEAVHDQDPNFFESLSTMAFLAGMGQRLKVGVAGLVLPLRDPRVLAKQMATLSVLSGGRATFALAIGAIPNDFEVMGVPFHRRGRITDEYLDALHAILSPAPTASFQGKYLTFKDGEFYPKPDDISLWICGTSDAAHRRVARIGRGSLCVYLSVEEYAAHANRLTQRLLGAGRSPADVVFGLEFFVTVAPSRRQAIDIARRSLEHKFGTLERGLEVSMIGTPQEVQERIAAYAGVGVQFFEFKFVCHDTKAMLEMMESLASSVTPAFV